MYIYIYVYMCVCVYARLFLITCFVGERLRRNKHTEKQTRQIIKQTQQIMERDGRDIYYQ